MKVTFYRVKDNSSKIQFICRKSQEAFHDEKRLIIVVPNDQAAQYVDALLWKIPEESFIPHRISDKPSKDWIAISLYGAPNFNEASRAINLSPQPLLFTDHLEDIFELFDESDPQKKELSEKRFSDYQRIKLLARME